MKIVVDTNVLVSGIMTPAGPCGEINYALVTGRVSVCADARIVLEYNEVLRRPRLALATAPMEDLLAHIEETAEYVSASPLPRVLPDRGDEPFLEVAIAAQADYLVTGNMRHFPAELCCGMRVISPAEFVKVLRSGDPSRPDTGTK